MLRTAVLLASLLPLATAAEPDQRAIGRHGSQASLELWVPGGVERVRALIVDWAQPRYSHDVGPWLEAARTWGCAYAPSMVSSGKRIGNRFEAWKAMLVEAGDATGHPEVAQVPIVLIATQRQVDRGTVGALMASIGQPVLGVVGHAAVGYPISQGKVKGFPTDIPALSISGEETTGYNRFPDLRTDFRPHRLAGAPFALGLQPFADHEFLPWIGVETRWVADILEARLAADGSVRPIDPAGGWRGTPLRAGTRRVSVAHAEVFDGDDSRASWFPAQASAQAWAARQNVAFGTPLTIDLTAGEVGLPAQDPLAWPVLTVEPGIAMTGTTRGPAADQATWYADQAPIGAGATLTWTPPGPGLYLVTARAGNHSTRPALVVVAAERAVLEHRVGPQPAAPAAVPEPPPLVAGADQVTAAAAAVDRIEERLDAVRQALSGLADEHLDLVAEGLADGDDARLRLVAGQRGGHGTAVVPAWRAETLRDAWDAAFRGLAPLRDRLAYAVDHRQLTIADDRVSGGLTVHFRRNALHHQRLPLAEARTLPGMSTTWSAYDLLRAPIRRTPRPTRVELDLEPDPGRFTCVVEILGGFAGHRVEARFAWPPRPQDRPSVILAYNAARHEIDVARVVVSDTTLSGNLALTIHPDHWVPKDRLKRRLVFTLELELRQGVGQGTASIGLGDERQVLPARAVIRPRWHGRFTASGDFGHASGAIAGSRGPIAALAGLLPAPTAGNATLEALLERGCQAWRRLRSLAIANTAPTIDPWAASREEHLPQPVFTDAAALVAHLEGLADWAETEPADLPVATAAGPSPAFAPGTALAADAALPDQGWYHPAEWTILGPLPNASERLGVASHLPPLLPNAEATWPLDRARLAAESRAAGKEDPAVTHLPAALGVLAPPFANRTISFGARQVDQCWLATTTVTSERTRTVDLVVASEGAASLWLNRRLIWQSKPTDLRLRVAAPQRLEVELVAGTNRFLWLVDDDHGRSWARLNLGRDQASAIADIPAQVEAAPEALPPAFFDLEAGTNVVWSVDLPRHQSRPAVAGDAIVALGRDGLLRAWDAATGEERWQAPIAAGRDLGDEWPREAQPLWDGERVIAHANDGDLVALGADGQELWRTPAALTDADLYRHGSLVIAVGRTTDNWPTPGEGKWYGLLAVETANGAEAWRQTVEGHGHGRSGSTPRGGGGGPGVHQPWPQETALLATGAHAVVVVSKGAVVDATTGAVVAPHTATWVHAETQLTADASHLVFSSGGQLVVYDWWFDGAGRFHHRERWRHRTDLSATGNAKSYVALYAGRLFHHYQIPENGPHCPGPWTQLDIHDLADGTPSGRLKPLIDASFMHRVPPLVVGRRAWFLDGGGGGFGANEHHARLVVVDLAPARPRTLAVNRLPLRSTVPPIVLGSRLFLRTATSLVCISATDAGLEAGQREAARRLLADIAPPPVMPPERVFEPARELPAGVLAVRNRLRHNRSLTAWQVQTRLEVGPLAGLDDWAVLPDSVLRRVVRAGGTTFSLFNLQGHGLSTFLVNHTIDLGRAHRNQIDRPSSYRAVIDVPVERVWRLAHPGRGISVAINGETVDGHDFLRLRPGQHLVEMVVTPDYFDRPLPLLPVDVPAALAGGGLEAVPAWPTTWRVIGPLRGADDLPAQALAQPLGERLVLGDTTYLPHEMAVDDNGGLDLAPLAHCTSGQQWHLLAEDERPVGPFQPGVYHAFTEIAVAKPTTLVVNASADWFMTWWLDGEIAYSTRGKGNGKAATMVTAHTFRLDLAPGRHQVVVRIASGSKGCSFRSVAGRATGAVDRLPDDFPNLAGVAPAQPAKRIAPLFLEVTDPDRERTTWLARIEAVRSELAAIVEQMPGSVEAHRAVTLLAALVPR